MDFFQSAILWSSVSKRQERSRYRCDQKTNGEQEGRKRRTNRLLYWAWALLDFRLPGLSLSCSFFTCFRLSLSPLCIRRFSSYILSSVEDMKQKRGKHAANMALLRRGPSNSEEGKLKLTQRCHGSLLFFRQERFVVIILIIFFCCSFPFIIFLAFRGIRLSI